MHPFRRRHEIKNKLNNKTTYSAYCASAKCSPFSEWKDKKFRNVVRKKDTLKSVLKDVKPGTMECPDCGYILIWERNRGV